MNKNVYEETQRAPQEQQADAPEPRPTLKQVIIDVGGSTFSGWGPRIAGPSDTLRSLN